MGITEEMYKNEIRWCCPQKASPYYIYTIFVKSSGRVYVGYTIDPVRRFREHITRRAQAIQEDTKSLDNVVFFVVDTHDTKEDAGKFEMLWMADLNSNITGYNVAYTSTIPTVNEHMRFMESRRNFVECIKYDEELLTAFNSKALAYYEDVKQKITETTRRRKPKNQWVNEKERKPRETKGETTNDRMFKLFNSGKLDEYMPRAQVRSKPSVNEMTTIDRFKQVRKIFGQ